MREWKLGDRATLKLTFGGSPAGTEVWISRVNPGGWFEISSELFQPVMTLVCGDKYYDPNHWLQHKIENEWNDLLELK